MLLWFICIVISLCLLVKDTFTPRPVEILLCVMFAHFIAVMAIILWAQHMVKVIKYYRGTYGK